MREDARAIASAGKSTEEEAATAFTEVGEERAGGRSSGGRDGVDEVANGGGA